MNDAEKGIEIFEIEEMKNQKCKFGERMLIRKKNKEIGRKKEMFGKGTMKKFRKRKKILGRKGGERK